MLVLPHPQIDLTEQSSKSPERDDFKADRSHDSRYFIAFVSELLPLVPSLLLVDI